MLNKKTKVALSFSIALFTALMALVLPDDVLSPAFKLLNISVSVYWFYLAITYTFDK